MKKKLIWIILAVVLVVGAIGGGVFYVMSNQTGVLSSSEKQWIIDHKNEVIDIYMPRNVAGLTYMGKGMFFDYIEYVEKETEMKFNEIAYEPFSEVSDQAYSIQLVDQVEDNQIEILQDDYVLVTKEAHVYTSPQEIQNLKVGVLASDLETVKRYLEEADVEWVSFETEEELLKQFLPVEEETIDEDSSEELEEEQPELDGVVGLRTLYLDNVLTNNMHMAYHISEMNKTYVLKLNGEDTSNSILKKLYQKWKKEHYDESYNQSLLESYFDFKGVTEKERTSLREKSYMYAFMENGSYDQLKSKKLGGMNYTIIKSFAEFANIDMEYGHEYNSKEELENAFQEGKIDFFFNPYQIEESIGYHTVKPIASQMVVLSHVNHSMTVNSIASLQDQKVLTVKGSQLEEFLQQHGIESTSYDSISELLQNKEEDSFLVMDLATYQYYQTAELKRFQVSYIFRLDQNYGYVINQEDRLFAQLFDFYLEYMPIQNMVHSRYKDIYEDDKELYYWITIGVLAFLVLIQFLYNAKRVIHFFKHKRRKSLTKDEKIRYIDSLTSLKNRAYLNDSIEKWDNSEVYPQIIIIVDLNNIAYINDNFGHEEGDKVITEAANILIQTQMPKSEIIRTDGNEFLIYLVSYEEKQAVSYIRKLNKELKELSHGFGAAIGYSVIQDAIKTIDDAVNEATLDMRTNKEAMMEEEK